MAQLTKLWLLRWVHDDDCDYDMTRALVIRAESSEKARVLASLGAVGDEKASHWLVDSLSVCEELSASGEEEIVVTDFLRG